jgi:hypothetical protein
MIRVNYRILALTPISYYKWAWKKVNKLLPHKSKLKNNRSKIIQDMNK